MSSPEGPVEGPESGEPKTDYAKLLNAAQAQELQEPQAPEAPAEAVTSADREKSPEEAAQERFMRAALNTVPRPVLGGAINELAQEAQKAGQEFDKSAASQRVLEALKGGDLGLEPASLKDLVGRTKSNGFPESRGGIWEESPNPRTPMGAAAFEARGIVKSTVSGILGNR